MIVLKYNIDMFATIDLNELFYIPESGILNPDWNVGNTYKYKYKYNYKVIVVKK